MTDTPRALVETCERLRPRSRFALITVLCPHCGAAHTHVWERQRACRAYSCPAGHGNYQADDYANAIQTEMRTNR